MGDMKTDSNWHNELKKHYGVLCTYCPEICAHSGPLNRHIHNQHSHGVNYNTTNWIDVWKDRFDENA